MYTVKRAKRAPSGIKITESSPLTKPKAKKKAKRLIREASTCEVGVFGPDGRKIWAPSTPTPGSVKYT